MFRDVIFHVKMLFFYFIFRVFSTPSMTSSRHMAEFVGKENKISI